MTRMLIALAVLLGLGDAARAEYANYGRIELTGLARQSWHLNPRGESYAMVCNVNGPDGFLSVRSGPGTGYRILRKLERLAIVTIDTRDVQGQWVRVVTAHRTHSRTGQAVPYRDLHVSGWAHSGYLCDFIDY